MKILTLTNLYPPYYIGGYEINTEKVVDGLIRRGHEVSVLTSTYGVKRRLKDKNIFRCFDFSLQKNTKLFFRHPLFYIGLLTGFKEIRNSNILKQSIRKFKPDIILINNLTGLSNSILFAAVNTGLPIVFRFGDPWLLHTQSSLWYEFWNECKKVTSRNLLKQKIIKILERYYASRNIKLEFNKENINKENAVFCSDYLRQEHIKSGFNFQDSKVIFSGVNFDIFKFKNIRSSGHIKILYAGRIVSHKGVHTAIEAVGCLVKEGFNITLSIAGETENNIDYIESLKSIIRRSEDGNWCRFIGKFKPIELADVYNQHHILVFPSIFQEPFGNILLEAMASRMAVVSTTQGGTKEFLKNEKNCLTFPANDSIALSKQLERVIANSGLRERIALNGERMAREEINVEKMIDGFENFLLELVMKNKN